jgi:hypothetical protein
MIWRIPTFRADSFDAAETLALGCTASRLTIGNSPSSPHPRLTLGQNEQGSRMGRPQFAHTDASPDLTSMTQRARVDRASIP